MVRCLKHDAFHGGVPCSANASDFSFLHLLCRWYVRWIPWIPRAVSFVPRSQEISESLHGNLSIHGGGALPLSHLGQCLFVIGVGFHCCLLFYRSDRLDDIIAALSFDPTFDQAVRNYATTIMLAAHTDDFGFDSVALSDEVFGHIFRCVSVGVLVKFLELALVLVASHHTEWPISLRWLECVDFAHIGFMVDAANCSCA